MKITEPVIHAVSPDVAYLEQYMSESPTVVPTGNEYTDESATIIPGLAWSNQMWASIAETTDTERFLRGLLNDIGA
jgi:hypothetical protein